MKITGRKLAELCVLSKAAGVFLLLGLGIVPVISISFVFFAHTGF